MKTAVLLWCLQVIAVTFEYELKCPAPGHWRLRARKFYCGQSYVCLLRSPRIRIVRPVMDWIIAAQVANLYSNHILIKLDADTLGISLSHFQLMVTISVCIKCHFVMKRVKSFTVKEV
ncbi:uncharacterized protein LOC134683921 [Mytilus trossulus]|uniref:uncharacterized protein LOC134683921 n=1 Tax=Mytilus trossulus TaxID=6551 RepID=UPI003003BEC6